MSIKLTEAPSIPLNYSRIIMKGQQVYLFGDS